MLKEKIRREILSWENIEEKPNRFGNMSFYVNNVELCHFHSEIQMDIRKPKKSLDDKRIAKNPYSTLFILFNFKTEKDILDMLALIKESYIEILNNNKNQ